MAADWSSFLSPGNLVDFVKNMDFPCSKQDLIDYAEEQDAPQQLIGMLNKLPDKEYNSPQDLVQEASKSVF